MLLVRWMAHTYLSRLHFKIRILATTAKDSIMQCTHTLEFIDINVGWPGTTPKSGEIQVDGNLDLSTVVTVGTTYLETQHIPEGMINNILSGQWSSKSIADNVQHSFVIRDRSLRWHLPTCYRSFIGDCVPVSYSSMCALQHLYLRERLH